MLFKNHFTALFLFVGVYLKDMHKNSPHVLIHISDWLLKYVLVFQTALLYENNYLIFGEQMFF